MGYRSLKINNFRAINELEIDGFKRVNIITGRNNCGKTSILEALFLISGMSNPQLLLTINNMRDMMITSDEDFSSLFADLDFSKTVRLSAKIDGNERSLTIKPLLDQVTRANSGDSLLTWIPVPSNELISTNKAVTINGLFLEFCEDKNKQQFVTVISVADSRNTVHVQYKEKIHCAYLNTKLILSQLDKNISKLLINKQLGSIIEILQKIDKRLLDIRMGAGGMIYADIGITKLIPLNGMGDGIRRLLAIIAAISNNQNGILLIDEIENGFHYLSLEVLWKAIFMSAEKYNVQLFITTHSRECISALVSARQETQYNDFGLFRIEKNENVHRALPYTGEMVQVGIEEQYEMR